MMLQEENEVRVVVGRGIVPRLL
jgi:hypothetical protein